MPKSLLLPAACCLLVLTASVAAQNPPGANPFGGADPFGGDPFATAPNGKQKKQQPQAKTDLKPRTAPRAGTAEDRLRAALSEMTTFTFVNLPLSDAVKFLGVLHDIPIVVDKRALEEIGLSAEEPVTLSLKNVRLRSFLRLLLRNLELTYMIRDEVLQITTPEAAKTNMVLQTYPFPETLIDKSEQVITALTATVTPAQWEAQGGPCTVAAVDNVLIVSGSDSVQEGVVDFLQKLDEAFQRHTAKQKAEPATQP
jgi:type II secretory pathway component GspD/PulD (secretin)